MRPVFLAVLAVLVVLAADVALACDPDPCIRPRFAPRNGGYVPANGTLAFIPSGNVHDGNPPDGLALIRRDDGARIPFDVVPDPAQVDPPGYLVRFRYWLEPGLYRATFPDRGCDGTAPWPDREVNFTVTEPADPPTWTGEPRADPPGREEIFVDAVNDACLATIDAAVSRVRVVPACTAWPWRDVARYAVAVDGVGDRSFYGDAPAWKMHAACGALEHGEDPGLAEGHHEATLSLHLPGETVDPAPTAFAFALDCAATGAPVPEAPDCLREPVELAAPAPPPHARPSPGADAGGGCATGGGGPAAGAAALSLVGLALRKRRG